MKTAVESIVPSVPTMRFCGAVMTSSGSARNADMKWIGNSSSSSSMLNPIPSVWPVIRTIRIAAWTAKSNRYPGDMPCACPHFQYKHPFSY